MTWTGRQLTTLTQNGKQNTYKYDVDGLRLEKTAGGVTTQYQYVNGQLLGEKRSDGVILRYTYDALGVLSGIQYKNAAGVTTNYIVRCTLSGDVDQIYNTKGNLLARYIYDTWGSTLSVTDASGKAITDPLHIANINPIRYRGYYYDAETGLYYLQSRYYDTVTKRYINPDGYVFTGQDMQSGNMFAYCGNQPVDRCDQTGNRWEVAEGGYGGGGGGGLLVSAAYVIAVTATAGIAYATAASQLNIQQRQSTQLIKRFSSVLTAASIASSAYKQLDKNQSIYTLTDSNHQVVYVGRTVDPVARERAHKLNPNRADLKFDVIESGLNYYQARGLEQYYMTYYHTLKMSYHNPKAPNQINGINRNRPDGYLIMNVAFSYLDYVDNQISNEILNWLGI